jgi:predicted nucleic acid-binding protein
MSRPVMVDSSWYISMSRKGRDPLRELHLFAESREIAVCGLICAEVGRGVRVRRFLERFQQAWAAMLYVPSSRERWTETLDLAWSLDRQGLVLPLADLHIAACALHIQAAVLTTDGHFQNIPGLVTTGQLV